MAEELPSDRPINFQHIIVEGHKWTNTDFIRKRFVDALKTNNLNECTKALSYGLQDLQEFDIFEEIYPNIIPSVNPIVDNVVPANILVSVKEKSRVMATIGGYTQGGEPSAAFEAYVRNVFGRAETLRMAYEQSYHGSTIWNASFSKPNLLDKPIIASMSVERKRSNMSDFASLIEESTGASISVTDVKGAHRLTYEGVWRDNTAVQKKGSSYEPSESIIKETMQPSAKSSIRYTRILDRLNSTFAPTSGYRVEASTEVAGLGGDVNFVKSEFSSSYFLPIPKLNGVSLGFLCHAGILRPWSAFRRNASVEDRRTLFNDRFFLGGPTSVRGFDRNQIGPKDSDDSLGGDLMIAAGINLSFPFPPLREQGIRGHLFATCGNLSSLQSADQKFTSVLSKSVNDSRISVGAGIVWPLPIGRLELNYSFPFRAKQHERTSRFQFDFGVGFL